MCGIWYIYNLSLQMGQTSINVGQGLRRSTAPSQSTWFEAQLLGFQLQLPTKKHPGRRRQWMMAQVLGSLQPMRVLERDLGSWLLASAWLNPSSCKHLRSEWTNRWKLFLYLPPCLSNKMKINHFLGAVGEKGTPTFHMPCCLLIGLSLLVSNCMCTESVFAQ